MGTTLIAVLIGLALLILWRRFGAAREEVVNGTRVLVSSLGREAGGGLEEEDAGAYSNFYRHVKVVKAQDADDLTDSVGRGDYDVVHLLCEVDADGRLVAGDDSRLKSGDLLEACRKGDVKLLFLAQGNPVQHYTLALPPAGSRGLGLGLNLALTLDRKGESFRRFLVALLARMSTGDTMPVAWVDLAPQIPDPPPGSRQDEQPGLVFVADRGGVKLMP